MNVQHKLDILNPNGNVFINLLYHFPVIAFQYRGKGGQFYLHIYKFYKF